MYKQFRHCKLYARLLLTFHELLGYKAKAHIAREVYLDEPCQEKRTTMRNWPFLTLSFSEVARGCPK